MIEVSVQNLVKYYGATEIINGISLELKTKERIGIIGNNGCGKTTLFKIIAGIEGYDEGIVSLRKGIKVGYLDQIPDYPNEFKVINVLYSAFDEAMNTKERMIDLEKKMSDSSLNKDDLDSIMKDYGVLQENFEVLGGYDIGEKIAKISSGLKFDESFIESSFHQLSGGEKTRVILGRLLLEENDILLLDEPTNHLDVTSIEWLEEYLNNYNGSVMVVSHDRFFLDRVITSIIEIENKACSLYHGNYSYYVDEKERRILQQLEAYEQQQKKIKSMEEAIRRFRDWGTRSDDPRFFKKAANMQKRIDKMDHIDKPKSNDKKMKLSFEDVRRSGKEVLSIKRLYKSFDTLTLFENTNIDVRYQDRVALLGGNGCGKTTLLQLIMNAYYDQNGELRDGVISLHADMGDIKIGSSVKIGYHDQNVMFKDENTTILECLREELPMPEGQARQILSRFLFYSDDVYKKVSSLSGGERSRLKLCFLLHQNVNFLILDEPTNHLDMNSREVLEDALLNFDGTILFVSHDRYFINKITEKVMEVQDYKIKAYNGDYNYYKEQKSKDSNSKQEMQQVNDKQSENEIWRLEQKEIEKQNRKHEKQLDSLEQVIEELEAKLMKLNYEAQTNSNDYERLCTIYKEKEELKKLIDEKYNEWELLS